MEKTRYVISYDISDSKRLQKVAKIMEDFGQRVLYSVFECNLTPGELLRLKGVVEPLLDPLEDKVLYYSLCKKCTAKTQLLGATSQAPHGEDLEVI